MTGKLFGQAMGKFALGVVPVGLWGLQGKGEIPDDPLPLVTGSMHSKSAEILGFRRERGAKQEKPPALGRVGAWVRGIFGTSAGAAVEAVDGGLTVFPVGAEHHGGEIGVVDGVGIVLGLEAEAAVFWVADAVFPPFHRVEVHIVAGVELDGRLGGEDLDLQRSHGAGR